MNQAYFQKGKTPGAEWGWQKGGVDQIRKLNRTKGLCRLIMET